MTRRRLFAGSRYSQGFSLIELMVSLTIGLVIALASFAAYIGIAGASKMAEAQGRMNEDAEAALTILTQQLRMAGNNPDQTNRVDNLNPTLSSRRNPVYQGGYALVSGEFTPALFTLSSFTIRGCDGTFSNIQAAGNIDSLTCAAGVNALSDSLAVSYEADIFNTVPVASVAPAALWPTDCIGNRLTTNTATLPAVDLVGNKFSDTVTYAVADNRFYIGSSASVPSLFCQGNGIGSTATALVENVEDMQLTYGATASGTTVAGYLRADQILSEPTILAPLANNAARWQKVLSVRICVLVRSENPVVSDAASAQYFRCDGTLEASPPDLRLRRAYSTTVVLRNRQL